MASIRELLNMKKIEGIIDGANKVIVIPETNFVPRADGKFETTYTHSLDTNNVIIQCFNNINESIESSYSIIDKDNIKVVISKKQEVKLVICSNYYVTPINKNNGLAGYTTGDLPATAAKQYVNSDEKLRISTAKLPNDTKAEIEKLKNDSTRLTTAKDITGAINELFQNVVNGKTVVASAITDKGVSTSETDTFTQMAENITNIVTKEPYEVDYIDVNSEPAINVEGTVEGEQVKNLNIKFTGSTGVVDDSTTGSYKVQFDIKNMNDSSDVRYRTPINHDIIVPMQPQNGDKIVTENDKMMFKRTVMTHNENHSGFFDMNRGDIKGQILDNKLFTELTNDSESHTAILYNDNIYILGGYYGDASKKVMIYNITKNILYAVNTLPNALFEHTATLYNGKIYVIGGLNSNTIAVNTVYIYDIIKQNWSNGTNIPAALYGHTATLYNDKIYVIGGSESNTVLNNTVYIYDITKNTWSNNQATHNVSGHTATLYNDKIYVIAWINNNTSNSTLIYDIINSTWTTGENAPDKSASYGHTATLYNDKIYVMGGSGDNNNYLNTVYIYDIAKNKWTTGNSNVPVKIKNHTATLYNDKIYVIGGRNSEGYIVKTIYCYNLKSESWLPDSFATLPFSLSATGHNNRLQSVKDGFLFKRTGSSNVYKYDILSNTSSIFSFINTTEINDTSSKYIYEYNNNYLFMFPYVNDNSIKCYLSNGTTKNIELKYYSSSFYKCRDYFIIGDYMYAFLPFETITGGSIGESEFTKSVLRCNLKNVFDNNLSIMDFETAGYIPFNYKGDYHYIVPYKSNFFIFGEENTYLFDTKSGTSMIYDKGLFKSLSVFANLSIKYVKNNMSFVYNDLIYFTTPISQKISDTGYEVRTKICIYDPENKRLLDEIYIGDTLNDRAFYYSLPINGKAYMVYGDKIYAYELPDTLNKDLPKIPIDYNGSIIALPIDHDCKILIRGKEIYDYNIDASIYVKTSNIAKAGTDYIRCIIENTNYNLIFDYKDIENNTLNSTCRVYYKYTLQDNTSPIPTTRMSPSSFAYNGEAYIIGGTKYDFTELTDENIIECYNPQSNTWLPQSKIGISIPSNIDLKFFNMITIVCKDKLYIFGGSRHVNSLVYDNNKYYIYNFTSKTWLSYDYKAKGNIFSWGFEWDNKIYLINSQRITCYDIETNSFIDESELGWLYKNLNKYMSYYDNRNNFIIDKISGKLLLFTPDSDKQPVSINLPSRRSSVYTKTYIPRGNILYNNAVPNELLIYNSRNDLTSGLTELYSFDKITKSMSFNGKICNAYGSTAFLYGNATILIFGGWGSSTKREIMKYDIPTKTVSLLSSKLPFDCISAYVIEGDGPYKNKHYLLGNWNNSDAASFIIYGIAVNSDSVSFTSLATSNYNLTNCKASYYNEKIYCVGPDSGKLLIFIFDLKSNTFTDYDRIETPTNKLMETIIQDGILYIQLSYNIIVQYDIKNKKIINIDDPKISYNTNNSTTLIGRDYDTYYNFYVDSLYKYSLPTPWICNKTVYPGSSYDHTATLYNDKIYVMGGYNGTNLNTVYIYDISKNTWGSVANLPDVLKEHTATLYNDKIYVIGGYSSGSSNKVYIYDISKNTWSFGANLPNYMNAHAATLYNDKIYVIGGHYSSTGTPLNTVYIYDITKNTWSNGNNMPTSRYQHTATLYEDKIYVIGGIGALNTLSIYDITKNTWSNGTDVPIQILNHRTVLYNDKIYVIGGYNNISRLNTVYIYDITKNTWSNGSSLPSKLDDHTATLYNDKIYVIGGFNGASGLSSIVNTVYIYDLQYDYINTTANVVDTEISIELKNAKPFETIKHRTIIEPKTSSKALTMTAKVPVEIFK